MGINLGKWGGKVEQTYRLGILPFKEDTRYAYAVGRVRALETRLLARHDFERMVDARDPEEALKVLSETAYAPAVSRFGEPHQYEELLRSQLRETLELVSPLFVDQRLIEFFQVRYDYHNVKVLLKAKHSGRDLDAALIDLGTVGIERLRRVVSEGTNGIPEHLFQTIWLAEVVYRENGEPHLMDIEVDRRLFSCLLGSEVVKELPFLLSWVKREIDLANIRAFLRIKCMGGDIDVLKSSLIDGGSLSLPFFFPLEEQPLEALPQAFSRTPYARLVEEGVDGIIKSDSFSRLERLGDEFIISFLRSSNRVVFGPEPIVTYLLLREYELKKIRTIMVGKVNDLPREWIKERLPDVHV